MLYVVALPAAVMALSGTVLLVFLIRETRRVHAFDRRLAVSRNEALKLAPGRAVAGSDGNRARDLARQLAGAVVRAASVLAPIGAKERDKLRRMLRTAGYRRADALSIYLAMKVIAGIAFGAIASVFASAMSTWGQHPVVIGFVFLAGAIFGSLIPEFAARARSSARNQRMVDVLPYALDLLVMCLEAGLTFEHALLTTSEEVEAIEPGLSGELRELEAELRLGSDHRTVLQDFQLRTDVPGLQDLAVSLLQSERHGTPPVPSRAEHRRDRAGPASRPHRGEGATPAGPHDSAHAVAGPPGHHVSDGGAGLSSGLAGHACPWMRPFMHRTISCSLMAGALAGAATLAVATGLHAAEPIKPVPAASHVDPAKAALGRLLFHDTRLSRDDTIACASCHNLATGGDDGRAVSTGIEGLQGVLNSPTVFNVGLNFKQFWDGRADSLEDQVDAPIQSPVEMGSLWSDVIATLYQDDYYPDAFQSLYADGITRDSVKNALAEFMRSLNTPNSRFDQWLQGDENALSAEEIEGYTLFKDYGCVSCHQGANVGGNMFQVFGVINDFFARRGNLTEADLGRFNVTRASRGPARVQGSQPPDGRLHRALLARWQCGHVTRRRRCDVRIPVGARRP